MAFRHERLEPVERRLAADRLAHVTDQHCHLMEAPSVERQSKDLQQDRYPGMRCREIGDQNEVRGDGEGASRRGQVGPRSTA